MKVQSSVRGAGTTSLDSKVEILLVDDDPTKRFTLKTVLAPLGQNVVEASSGTDALRQLLRQDFAVILLDVRMPIMDGFETAKLIRQRPRSELTPIIFVTAFDRAGTDMGRGYELGAVDFVFAPVVPTIMRAKVTVFVELYRAQQELRRYRTQLEQLVQERTTALTAMRMRTASKRMTSVFDGLQSLFQLTGGEIHRERVDVSAMAADIVEELRASSPDRKVDIGIAAGLTASADARLARILLANLIGNAWKFTSKSPAAKIEVGREIVDGDTRLFVRDNGVGFDMLYAHKLFGAFQRLHSQSEFPGAGIGLATVRRIVNRHGGRAWADGAVGEGATFYIVL